MQSNEPDLELMTLAEAEAAESNAEPKGGRVELGIELFALFANTLADATGGYDRSLTEALDAAAAHSVFLDATDGN
jgi:hypothetical protein